MKKNLFVSIAVIVSQCLVHTVLAQQGNIPLQFSTRETHDLSLAAAPPGHAILTQGPSPWLLTMPLPETIEKGYTVLTFDYYAVDYLHDFEVLFNPASTPGEGVKDELGIREGWSRYSLDLSEKMGSWGRGGDVLKIVFGRSAGYQMQIRNLELRKPTEAERQKAADRPRREQEERLRKARLEKYLSADFPNQLTRIFVMPRKIMITGVLTESTPLFLAEAAPHEIVFDVEHATRRISIDGKNNFSVTLDRFIVKNGQQYDRLLSRWVLISRSENGYALRSHARWADTVVPLHNLPEELPAGRKGLGDFTAAYPEMIEDLDSLGITSVTVNMWIVKMLRSGPSSGTLTFHYNGKPYYADLNWVKAMDKTLQETARRDIHVSAIILIDKAANSPDTAIGNIFEHPGCDPAGIYSMANMTDPRSVEYYAAAIDFLAKRYGRPDKKHGRVHHWIVHNEVDAGWVWTNMGETDKLLYMDTYHRSMRLIHHITRKYNPHAKVFISLTHHWNWTSDKQFYHSLDLLNILLRYSRAEGDFDWAIAHHPFPESLFEPRSWLDKRCDFTFNTPLITFKNIEVLNEWVKQPYTRYLGKTVRTVFLSEQGPNSRDYSEKSLLEQAASMAYVWKKMEKLDEIKVFQYQSWRDYREEGGMLLGMRRFPDDEQAPFGKKPVWYVFRDMGTPAEDTALAFAKEIIGIRDWSEVQYNFQKNAGKKDP